MGFCSEEEKKKRGKGRKRREGKKEGGRKVGFSQLVCAYGQKRTTKLPHWTSEMK